MELCIVGFKSFLIFVLISTLPYVACLNIDCNGKAFHCVNSTHFKICVDFGGGISTTVDEYLIPCPQDTVCKSYNLYECEYEQTTTFSPVKIQSEVTNEVFESSGVSLFDHSHLIAVTPITQEQATKLTQKYDNLDSTSVSPFTILPNNASTVANVSELYSSSTPQSSAQELLFDSSSPENATKILIHNIIQLATENNNGISYNTETPSYYSTLEDGTTNDHFINENSISVNQTALNITSDLNETINQVSYVTETTGLDTASTPPFKNREQILKQDIPQILNNVPNKVTPLNNLDSATTFNSTHLNTSDFLTNNNNFKISTIDPFPKTSSVNGSFELNSLLKTPTTETYYTDEALTTTAYELKDENIRQQIKKTTVSPRPIQDTTDDFLSTVYTNTEADIGKLKKIDPNLENSGLVNFNTSYSIISAFSLPTTTVNGNEITSQMNTVLDIGVNSGIKTDLFLDKQNLAPIDKEQTPDKEILNFKNTSDSSTPKNDSKYIFSTEPYFPEEKFMLPTESVTLTTEVVNETRAWELNDLEIFYTANGSNNPLISSLFPEIIIPTEPTSYQKIKSETFMTNVDHLVDETTPITESYSKPMLILNDTTFVNAGSSATINLEKNISTDINSIPAFTTVSDSEIFLKGNSSKKVTEMYTDFVPYIKVELEKYISTETPMLLQSTLVNANEPFFESNILDLSVKTESPKDSMNFSSSFRTTVPTKSFTYNTLPNDLTMNPLSASENKTIPMLVNNMKPPEIVKNNEKSKGEESVIIEKKDKNETQSVIDSITPANVFTNDEKLTTDIPNDYASSTIDVSFIDDNNLSTKSINTDPKLPTHKIESGVNYLFSTTTPIVVQQHEAKSNTSLINGTEPYKQKETRFNSSSSYSEKHNPSNNSSYVTTLEKPIFLTNVTKNLDVSTLPYNETVSSTDGYNILNDTNQEIIRNSTEFYDPSNIFYISDTTTEIINKFTTTGTLFSETVESKNTVINKFQQIIIKESNASTDFSKDSKDLKSSGINLDMTTEYRIMPESDASTNATLYTIDSRLTIENSPYIDSNVSSTMDYFSTETIVATTFDNYTLKSAKVGKPIIETKLITEAGISDTYPNVEGRNLTDIKVNTEEINNTLQNIFKPVDMTTEYRTTPQSNANSNATRYIIDSVLTSTYINSNVPSTVGYTLPETTISTTLGNYTFEAATITKPIIETKLITEGGMSNTNPNFYGQNITNININTEEINNNLQNIFHPVDMPTEYRMTPQSNANTNAPRYTIDSVLTSPHIDSKVSSTMDYLSMDTTMATTFHNYTFKSANVGKPIIETKLITEEGISDTYPKFEGQNIIDKNINTEVINNNLQNQLLPVVSITSGDYNGTEKNILTSDTGNYQTTPLNMHSPSPFPTNFTDPDIRKNITSITEASVTDNFHGDEYNHISTSTNGYVQAQVDDINVQFSNKTITLSEDSFFTTISAKENDSLYNSLDPPTTESNNKSYDSFLKHEYTPNTTNNLKNNTMTNQSMSNGVIDNNEIITQSNGVPTINTSDCYFKSLSKIQGPLQEINKTYNFLSNNVFAENFSSYASISDNLNETTNPNTDIYELLDSLSSKTTLNKTVTDALSPSVVELSRKKVIENVTISTPFPYANSTLNYLNTKGLLTDTIEFTLEANTTSKSKTEMNINSPKLIRSDLNKHLVTTSNYYSVSTTTSYKLTERIKENKTNFFLKSTVKTMHAKARYNDTGKVQTEPEFVCVKRGKFSDRIDCNKFYLCIGRVRPIVGVCPPNTVFSDFLKQCTKNLGHCIRNNQFKCTTTGRFNNILSNNTYFICAKKRIGFVRFTLQCQKGYYLDKRNTKCSLESLNTSTSEENNSKITKEVSVEKSKEEFKKKDYFECEREGKFEDPENCRKYYVCKKGKHSKFRRKIKKCDSDEVFHKKKKKCVDEESYECNI